MNLFEPRCPSPECNVERRWRKNFQPFLPFSLSLSFSSLPSLRRFSRSKTKDNKSWLQLRHGAPLTPDNGSVLVSSRLIAKLFLFSRCREAVTSDYSSASSTSLLYHGGLEPNDRLRSADAHHSRDWTHAIVCIRALRVRRSCRLDCSSGKLRICLRWHSCRLSW